MNMSRWNTCLLLVLSCNIFLWYWDEEKEDKIFITDSYIWVTNYLKTHQSLFWRGNPNPLIL